MQVWVLRDEETGKLRGRFHDGHCAGFAKGETEGAEYIRMDIEDLPDDHGACKYCFEGRVKNAAGLRTTGYTPITKTQPAASGDADKGISVGQHVKLRLASGEVKTFTLVRGQKGNPSDGVIASESGMGKALLGREEGETVPTKGGPLKILSVRQS